MYEIATYGNHNLQNSRFVVGTTDNRSLSSVNIQTIPLARGNGDNVVNTRLASRPITLEGGILASTNDLYNSYRLRYEQIFNQDAHLLRTISKWRQVYKPITTSNVVLTNDATTAAINTTDWQWDTPTSLSWNVDTSLSANNYATMVLGFVSVSLVTEIAAAWNVEFWIYIPDAQYITSLDFKLGNDSTHYYSANITGNLENGIFENGWNLISIPFANLSATGSVTASAIDYLGVQLNYSSLQENMTGVLLDGVIMVDDTYVRNYKCRVQEVSISGKNSDIADSSTTIQLLNYTGYSTSTHPITLFTATGVTATNNTQKFVLDGSISSLPLFTLDINTATAIQTIEIANLYTSRSIILDASGLSAGSNLQFGSDSYIVTKDGENVDFTGTIPLFGIGTQRAKMIITGSGDTLTPSSIITRTGSRPASAGDRGVNLSAQSFLTTTANPITKITYTASTYLFSITGAPFSLNWSIRTDSAGSPSATIVGSGTLAVTPGFYNNQDFTISGLSISVSTATTYWFVIEDSYTTSVNTAYNLYWDYDSANPYASGVAKTSANSGSTWSSSLTGDNVFRIYQSPTPAWNLDWSAATYKYYR